jgi:hypothetical protein
MRILFLGCRGRPERGWREGTPGLLAEAGGVLGAVKDAARRSGLRPCLTAPAGAGRAGAGRDEGTGAVQPDQGTADRPWGET